MKLGARLVRPRRGIPNIASIVKLRGGTQPPATYDFDTALGTGGQPLHPPTQMDIFGNAQYGDCVIAARANHTLRLAYRAGQQIDPQEVTNEYIAENEAENGGSFMDNGLSLPDSLERWRTNGWAAAGTSGRTIQSYPRVSWQNPDDLRAVLYNDLGIQIAVALPVGLNVVGSFGPGNPWTNTSAETNGGHAFLLIGYDANGPIGITWGVYQNLSWDWLDTFCTDAYAVIPDANTIKNFGVKRTGGRRREAR